MIKVVFQNNTDRPSDFFNLSNTPAEALSALNVDYSHVGITLDGGNLSAADLNKSFESLGVQDETTVWLMSVVHKNNAMIKVTFQNNTDRPSDIFSLENTPAEALSALGVDYSHVGITLDGGNLSPADLNRSFGALGVADESNVWLMSVVHKNNAR